MADKKKNRKPMTSKGKAAIALAVMLVLTLCVSWISIFGMKLDAEGVNILLPWLPVSASKVPASLVMGLDVGEANAADITLAYPTAVPTAAPTEAPAEEAVEAAGDAASEVVEAAGDAASEVVEAAGDAASEVIEAAGDAASEVIEAAGDAASEVVAAAEDAASEVIAAAEDAASEVVAAAEDAASEVVAAAEEGASEIVEGVETVIEYTAEFKQDAASAKEILEKRFAAMGRMAAVETTGDNTLRMAYPKYVSVNGDDPSSAMLYAASAVGDVKLTAEEAETLSENVFKGYRVQYYTSNSGSGYALFLQLNADAKAYVEKNLDTVALSVDGEEVVPSGSMANYYTDGNIVLSMSSNAYAEAYGAVFTSGRLPVRISNVAADEAGQAGNTGLLRTILIIMWALVILAALYMIIRNHMVGLAATWSLWLYMVFFFFLIATVTLPVLTVLNWFAVLLTILVAVYVLKVELGEMDNAIVAGKDARSAVRIGFHSSVKQSWIIVGGELVLALILMIIPVTRQYGYILATGVVVTAVCCLGLFRWFAPCLTILGGSTQKAVSAKSSKK